jgi:hypothetical protein
MNLQQIIFFVHRDAHDTGDDKTYTYLSENAKRIHETYFLARTALRQNIDILSGKAALFIDRPIESDEQRVQQLGESNFVVSNRENLIDEEFSCAKHMPNRNQPTRLKNIVIDWDSVRHQIGTFYFCSEAIHYSLLPLRMWAQSGVHNQEIDDFHKSNPAFKENLDRQSTRLSILISMSLEKIERLRLRGRPKGFFRHQFFCWWSCSE